MDIGISDALGRGNFYRESFTADSTTEQDDGGQFVTSL